MKNDPILSEAPQKKLKKELIKTASEDRIAAKEIFDLCKARIQDHHEGDDFASLAKVCLDSIKQMSSSYDKVSRFIEIILREYAKVTKKNIQNIGLDVNEWLQEDDD